jgi:hypothetical protein
MPLSSHYPYKGIFAQSGRGLIPSTYSIRIIGAEDVDKLPSVFNAQIPCNMPLSPSLFNRYTPTTRRVSSLKEGLWSIPAVRLRHRHSHFGATAVVADHCGEPVKYASSFGRRLSPAQRARRVATLLFRKVPQCCYTAFRGNIPSHS